MGKPSETTIIMHVYSVFQYWGARNVDREKAWQYARWKYGISTALLSSITYSSTQSQAGLTNMFTKSMKLGAGAFDTEWMCASTLGHENVHGSQSPPYFGVNKKQNEREACEWEFDHSNAPGYSIAPLTYLYTYDKSNYDGLKSYYADNGGNPLIYP